MPQTEATPGSSGRIGAGLMRTPNDQRDLFELLALYEPQTGLDAWLRRIDLSRATPLHVYHMAHRRPPDSIDAVMVPASYDARIPLAAALRSEEFRENVVPDLLHAFAELPRCAVLAVPGVRLAELFDGLAPVQAVLRDRLAVPDQDPPEVLLDRLSRLVRGIAHGGDVVVECVSGLQRYLARAGHRPHDRLVAVLDDPVSVMVGQACDAVAQLWRDSDQRSARTQAVARALGVTRLAPGAPRDELRRLAERALANPSLCQPNAICRTLSHTGAKQFHGALAAAAIFDIEITTRADLPRWLLERWGVVCLPPPDETPALLTNALAIDAFADPLLEATEDDRRIYDLVAWGLEQTGRPAITGQDLVRLAGPDRLSEVAASVFMPSAAQPFPAPVRRPILPDPIAARGPAAVSAHLSLGPEGGVRVSFGADGTSQDHTGIGWSVVEREARWTNGGMADLTLPCPSDPGPHVLRIDASPFVSAARLPRQRVGIQINGHAVALVELTERTLLECPIAHRILADQRQAHVTFTLPDAARPRAVDGGDDDRMLALYVREVAILPPGDFERAPEPAPPSAPAARLAPEPALAELAIRFESLGENCEFGLVQRRWGAEPLGLLRFASSPPDKLLPALRRGFAGMGAPGQLEIELHGGREYMVLDRRYGFLYHAWATLGEMTPEEILVREHRRLPFLIRKLIEDMEEGEKLFVYHAMRPLTEVEARALADVVGSFGRSSLLWMELADDHNPPGSVIRIGDRLLKGHMDRFAPGENAHDISIDCWVEVCRNALRVAGHPPDA